LVHEHRKYDLVWLQGLWKSGQVKYDDAGNIFTNVYVNWWSGVCFWMPVGLKQECRAYCFNELAAEMKPTKIDKMSLMTRPLRHNVRFTVTTCCLKFVVL